MPLPDYQSIMLPLLELAADDQEHRTRDAVGQLATHFHLSEEDVKKVTPSGQDYVFGNRFGWARTYLKKAGLLFYPRWGVFKITDEGRKLLDTHPGKIDLSVLKRYPTFLEFYDGPISTAGNDSSVVPLEPVPSLVVEQTPDELIAAVHSKLRQQIESELLTYLSDCSPGYFERVVVKLLTTMGYGGSLEDAGQAIGRSHDGGIDGEIKEDRLGLGTIYVQAKRWQENVSVRAIREFVGALTEKRAHKGVFMTTAKFTKEAVSYASKIDKRVVLLDGERMVSLMFDYGLGVTPTKTYVVKRVDTDFFDES